MISTEYVLHSVPFTIRRRVKWGDCDPAGVVYTVMFSEYVISAAELFYGQLFNSTPQRARDEHSFDTPIRALSFDFRSSLRPDDEFDMRVLVSDIRTRTYVLAITARTPVGVDVFHAQLTPICVAPNPRRGVPIPDVLRDALERYRASCWDLGVTSETANDSRSAPSRS